MPPMRQPTALKPADAQRPGGPAMFNRIARRYDLLNRVISLGLDRGWRRQLIAALGEPGDGNEVLDVATGTGDVAIAIARQWRGAHVTGLDPATAMLAVGHGKIAEAGLAARVTLIEADAQALPFANDRFAGCTIAFGIRNVPDRAAALAEMCRVTRPGGAICVLELSEPSARWWAAPTRWHVHHVVPRIGGLLSGPDAYRYLRSSIAAFPPPPEFAAQMRGAGLVDVTVTPMWPRVAHLYVGRAPA